VRRGGGLAGGEERWSTAECNASDVVAQRVCAVSLTPQTRLQESRTARYAVMVGSEKEA